MDTKQQKTPLYDALLSYVQERPVSFHVPGHKNGSVFHSKGRDYYEKLMQIDATEVEGLDDLHAPEGPILESQRLLSDLYGSQKSWFLVNGSTCGNLAVILGTCREGDIVLVQRNCHKSVLHGLMMAKAKPIFLQTIINKEWGTAEGLSPKTVKKAIEKYPHTKALILTYPSYYGIGQYMEEIVSIAHEHNVTIIVDEAHGAHFVAGEPFLKSSLVYGADYVVHSAHKTLPAMTMGSYLHVNHGVTNFDEVEKYLRMLQSSSPSYPIMASLDLARAYVGTLTKADLIYTKNIVLAFREQLQQLNGLKVLNHEAAACDLLKITLQSDGTYTGYELQEALRVEGIYTELADTRNVLLVMPIVKDGDYFHFEPIIHAIKRAIIYVKKCSKQSIIPQLIVDDEEITELTLSFHQMQEKRKQYISITEAADCIAAETITPYPPGVPYIIEGERLNQTKLNYLIEMLKIGAKFHGGSRLKEMNQILIYR